MSAYRHIVGRNESRRAGTSYGNEVLLVTPCRNPGAPGLVHAYTNYQRTRLQVGDSIIAIFEALSEGIFGPRAGADPGTAVPGLCVIFCATGGRGFMVRFLFAKQLQKLAICKLAARIGARCADSPENAEFVGLPRCCCWPTARLACWVTGCTNCGVAGIMGMNMLMPKGLLTAIRIVTVTVVITIIMNISIRLMKRHTTHCQL
jgi:hypothetical protein